MTVNCEKVKKKRKEEGVRYRGHSPPPRLPLALAFYTHCALRPVGAVPLFSIRDKGGTSVLILIVL